MHLMNATSPAPALATPSANALPAVSAMPLVQTLPPVPAQSAHPPGMVLSINAVFNRLPAQASDWREVQQADKADLYTALKGIGEQLRTDFSRLGLVDVSHIGIADLPPDVFHDGQWGDLPMERFADTGDVQFAPANAQGKPRALPVLCASAVETLYVCASGRARQRPPQPGMSGFTVHPVVMPDPGTEAGKACRDVIGGSLVGAGNDTRIDPAALERSDVVRESAATARRWSRFPDVISKKDWAFACKVAMPAAELLNVTVTRLVASNRTIASPEATRWLVRTSLSESLPMYQVLARTDLPQDMAMGSDEWVRCALGIERYGNGHWGMRCEDVMKDAELPATDTIAFTELAKSLYPTLQPHEATQRARNIFTSKKIPTSSGEA